MTTFINDPYTLFFESAVSGASCLWKFSSSDAGKIWFPSKAPRRQNRFGFKSRCLATSSTTYSVVIRSCWMGEKKCFVSKKGKLLIIFLSWKKWFIIFIFVTLKHVFHIKSLLIHIGKMIIFHSKIDFSSTNSIFSYHFNIFRRNLLMAQILNQTIIQAYLAQNSAKQLQVTYMHGEFHGVCGKVSRRTE